MSKQDSKKNYAFIDAQNLHQSSKNWGWKLDYTKLRKYLTEKYNVEIAYLFMGYMQEHTETYLNLQKRGFVLVFREALEYNGQFYKANCDTDLVLQAMIDYNEYHKAVVISGDGDFVSLINYLSSHDKLEAVLVPNKSAYSQFLKKASRGRLTYLNIHKTLLQDDEYEKVNPRVSQKEPQQRTSPHSRSRSTRSTHQLRATNAHHTQDHKKPSDTRTRRQANLDFIAQFKKDVAKEMANEAPKPFVEVEKQAPSVDEFIANMFPDSGNSGSVQKETTPKTQDTKKGVKKSTKTASKKDGAVQTTLSDMMALDDNSAIISFEDTLTKPEKETDQKTTKKPGRKKTSKTDADEVKNSAESEVKPAPKKRGRKPKVVATELQESNVEKPAPKKRGRKPKAEIAEK